MADYLRRGFYNISIDEELLITFEKHMQGEEISIGEEKGTLY